MSLTLQFHPDWPFQDGMVIEAMARDGRYRSQFETGTSNGGLTAYEGGDRWRWESRLFGGRYDTKPPDAADHDYLDEYVEAHIHGQVRFAEDVEALVLDPSHRDGGVAEAAVSLGCAVEYHLGFQVGTADLDLAYRGPEPVRLAQHLGSEIIPSVVAAAVRSGQHDPQRIKRVWHLLARFGHRGANRFPHALAD